MEEDEAGFAEALDGELGREGDGDAEGFEDVCRADLAGDGAVAMLGNASAGAGGDDGCAGRDVEGGAAAATGADDVDEAFALGVGEGDGGGVGAHDVDKAGEFRGEFAAGGECGEEGCGLNLWGFAGEHGVEHGARLLAGECGSFFGERAKDFFDDRHVSSIANCGDGMGRGEGWVGCRSGGDTCSSFGMGLETSVSRWRKGC